jgi:hypothetical protein
MANELAIFTYLKTLSTEIVVLQKKYVNLMDCEEMVSELDNGKHRSE